MSTETKPEKKTKILFWHCYGSVMEEGRLAGAYQVVTVGPTNLGPDDINPAHGKPMREVVLANSTWLAHFDHEPSALETDQLQPEDYQQYYPDGSERPWLD